MMEHPEVMNQPLISTAVQSILVSQMQDELRYGKQTYPDGTNKKLLDQRDVFQDLAVRASAIGELTWTHLVLAQTYEALGQEDAGELYANLARLARSLVQWMENLNDTHGGV